MKKQIDLGMPVSAKFNSTREIFYAEFLISIFKYSRNKSDIETKNFKVKCRDNRFVFGDILTLSSYHEECKTVVRLKIEFYVSGNIIPTRVSVESLGVYT